MNYVERLRTAHGLERLQPRVRKFAAAIQEARRQRARATVVVHCPGIPESQTITVRSRFGPMCSACGAVIDRSPSHTTIKAWPT
jgi:hypothetical protein